MEEIKICPLCGGNQFVPYLNCTDTLVSQRVFCIQRCNQCQLLLTNPRPDANTLGKYYQSDAYISHDDTKKGLLDIVYRTVRAYTLQEKEKLIHKSLGEVGSLLDYGCGTGAFLEVCQQKGWRIHGYEPDLEARTLAEKKTGRQILNDVNAIKARGPFDVITLWHVLEHVADLQATVSELTQSLRVGGNLIIAVPNPASADASQFANNWAAYDVPRHLYHFTPEVLIGFMEKAGLETQKQIPMIFDAYYIALMSTKARDGKFRYLESFLAGITSNRAAEVTGNYSSLTYVFRKV